MVIRDTGAPTCALGVFPGMISMLNAKPPSSHGPGAPRKGYGAVLLFFVSRHKPQARFLCSRYKEPAQGLCDLLNPVFDRLGGLILQPGIAQVLVCTAGMEPALADQSHGARRDQRVELEQLVAVLQDQVDVVVAVDDDVLGVDRP